MPKRSSKRRLDGLKLRRLQLAIDPKVFEQFAALAGPHSYNVTFEEMTKYMARKMEQRQQKTHFPVEYSVNNSSPM